jgi:hypothetical protein
MDSVVINERYTLVWSGGHASFVSDEEDRNQSIMPYLVNGMFGSYFRDEAIFEQCKAFMEAHDIPREMAANVQESDAYSTDEASQVGVGIVMNIFPVFCEVFPSQRMSDGYYGTHPVFSEKIVRACAARNIRDFTEILFGEYRKDLVKLLVSNVHCQDIFWLSLFAGHVPAEWIIAAMNDTTKLPMSFGSYVEVSHMDNLLSRLTPYECRRLMTPASKDPTDITEASRILSAIPEPLISLPNKRDAESLHNHFTLVSKGSSLEANFDIPDVIANLDNASFDGLTASVLPTAADYRHVGEVMDNCAGTAVYAVNALENKGYLVKFGNDEVTYKYLLELQVRHETQWSVKQLYGVKNSKLPEDDLKAINKFLTESIPEITLGGIVNNRPNIDGIQI